MVVLDHQLVMQANPMVPATAAGHGVFFQRAPAGGCLPCVKNLRPGAGNLLDELRRERGHASQALDKVEGGAFRREQRSRWALHTKQRLAEPTLLAVENLDAKLHALIHLRKRGQGEIDPGHDQRLTGYHHGSCNRVLLHQGQGRRIAAADIFGQGGLDQRQVIVRCERFRHRQKSWPSGRRNEAQTVFSSLTPGIAGESVHALGSKIPRPTGACLWDVADRCR